MAARGFAPRVAWESDEEGVGFLSDFHSTLFGQDSAPVISGHWSKEEVIDVKDRNDN